MDEARFAELTEWITGEGLVGSTEAELMTGFCERAVAAGLPLATGLMIIDTLHPIHEGRAVRWYQAKDKETEFVEYGRTNEGEAAANWRASPFYRLAESGEKLSRHRVRAEAEAGSAFFKSKQVEGTTEVVVMVNRFAAEGIIGEMDCVYSAWATDRTEGFKDREVAALKRLTPFLALAMKCTALGRIAETLVETYLGRDAGRMVLSGRIARGVADRIGAALWFSDLRGYTTITDTAAPEQIIPLLNDYADAVISAIHARGGDVLKLIGDGVLAIFRSKHGPTACRAAVAAAASAAERIEELNHRREAESLPTTHMYLGLHIGEVFFGNIGSKDRLDFTVVGPAVNETSRIAAMCRSVDQRILMSAAFARALDEPRRVVSVGRYALRGVGRPQELFTLDPEASAAQ
jgi:adenylate cyclase